MYGYGYRYNSGLVVGSGGGGGGFTNTYSTSFDGVDDYVHLGDDNSDLQPTGAFSLSVWVKFDSLTGIQGIWEATTTGGGGNNGYVLWKSSANKFQFYMKEGGVWKIASATTTVSTGTWYHILCTWDGSATSKIFINGIEEGSQSVSSINYNITTTINLGGYQSESISKPYQIDGNIDEASLFHSEISIGDVWDGSGSPTDLSLLATPPTHWYRMGDNGAYKSPQWLIPNNENKDKVSNYSFDFDGVDDYVDCGDSDTFSFGNGTTDSPFSISAWIKMDDATTFRISSKYTNTDREYIFTTDSSDKLSFVLYDLSSGGRIQRKYNTALTSFQGQWINVVATYDGNSLSSGILLYLNGTRVDDIDGNLGSYTAMENTTQPFEIGRNNLTSFANGKIDELSVFDKVLTPTEITSISAAPTDLSLLSTPPIAWYKMGEDSTFSGGVWTVPDSVGSNDGTSANMTIEDRVGEAPNSTNNALSFNMDEVDRTTDVPT